MRPAESKLSVGGLSYAQIFDVDDSTDRADFGLYESADCERSDCYRGDGHVDELKPVDDIQIDKWNSVPLPGSVYAGLKSAPAPRRDLSGVWDATGDATGGAPPGLGASGANGRRSVRPGNNVPPGGEPGESHIANPLPYTALGEKTLEARKPHRSERPRGSRRARK